MIINQYQIKKKGEDKMKEKQGYKIVDIKWDTDGDKALFDSLPQEIILPEQFCTEDKDDYDYLDEVYKSCYRYFYSFYILHERWKGCIFIY